MRNGMLSLIALGMLSGVTRADDPSPAVDTGETWNQLTEVPWRLVGRVLGVLIRKGMPEDQVRNILGKDQGFPTGGIAGGILFYTRYYPNLGMAVSFSGPGGEVRVDCVYSEPLFGGR
jgi:hypothetical protein